MVVVVVLVLVVVAVVVVVGEAGGRTAQKCTALLGHETKTITLIWNYCLGSTAAAFLLLGIFFGLIFFNRLSGQNRRRISEALPKGDLEGPG